MKYNKIGKGYRKYNKEFNLFAHLIKEWGLFFWGVGERGREPKKMRTCIWLSVYPSLHSARFTATAMIYL